MEIAIAGAGIAGLAAAALLSRQGFSITVYDKAPAPAPVGSGLIVQPTGQAVLAALGLSENLKARGARLDHLDGRLEGGKRKVLDVSYDALGVDVYGIAIHRAALFDMLFEAAREAGATINQDCEVVGVETAQEHPALVFANAAASAPFDIVIDALGVRSPLVSRQGHFLDYGALWANAPLPAEGFQENVLAQRYRGAKISSGVMPIGTLQDGGKKLAAYFWTLRAREFEPWRAAPLGQWKNKVLVLWPEVSSVLDHFNDHDQFVFAHYAHDTWTRPVEGRVIHIGDAWHAASPQLGQGANMALLDAYALVRALERKAEPHAAFAEFLRLRQNHVRLYQAISWAFTPFYQSDSSVRAFLRDLLAAPFSRMPPMPKLLASLVAGTLGDPLSKLGLR